MLNGPLLPGSMTATPSGPARNIATDPWVKLVSSEVEARNGHDHAADELLPRRDRGELRDLSLRGRPQDTEITGNRRRGLGLHGEARENSWNMTWGNRSPAGQIRQAAGRRNDNCVLTRQQRLVEDEAHLALAPVVAAQSHWPALT